MSFFDVQGIIGAIQILTESWTPWLVVPPGLLIGLIGGAIPGISGTMTLAIVLPVTIWMDFLPSLLFLTSVFTGAGFGGAIPAVLMNLPGTTSSIATTFDGYPMARRGEYNEALGIALMASTFGMLGSYVALFVLIDPISRAVVKIGPAEMVVVIAWGLTMIATLRGRNVARGLLAGMVGILLGTVGMSLKGYIRGTFGLPELLDGIPAVPAMLGLLAGGELFNLLQSKYIVDADASRRVEFGRIWTGAKSTFRHWGTLMRGSIIGALIGAMPGVGASVSNLISYAETRRTSDDPESFGKGNPKGVVAAESANSSSEGGAMATLLALGLPGGGGTAVILAAFGMHGITGGPRFIADNKDVVYAVIISNFAQGLLLLVLGLLFIRVASVIVKVPVRILVPSVFVIAVLCSYILTSDMSGPVTLILFSMLGWLMQTYDYSVAATVIGLLLGRVFEAELIRCYQISGGEIDYFLGRPVALALVGLLVVSLVYHPLKRRLKRRRARVSEG